MSGKDAGFTPATNIKVAVVGGRNPSDPAAIKLLPGSGTQVVILAPETKTHTVAKPLHLYHYP